LWVKLAVDFQTDPKVLGLSPEAELLFVRGMAYAKKHGRGEVPFTAFTLLTMKLVGSQSDLATEIVDAGLWEILDGCYGIIAWADWQTDGRSSEAGVLGAHNRWHRENPNDDCHLCHPNSTPLATPLGSDGVTLMREKELEIEIDTLSTAYSGEAKELADILAELMIANGCKPPKVTAKWFADMDRLLRIDNRDRVEAEKVLRWCQQDDFWRTNIMSPATFRKQYDKLRMKMNGPRPGMNRREQNDAKLAELYAKEKQRQKTDQLLQMALDAAKGTTHES